MTVAATKDFWDPNSGHAQMARMDELGEQLRRQASDLAAAEYRWLVALEEFDRGGGWYQQGAKTCAQWLSWACGLGPQAGRERVRVARSLAELPQISAEFAAGRLSYSKVRALTRIATPDNEAVLTSYGLSAPAAQVEEIVRLHRRSTDDGEAAQAAHERRFLRWTTLNDGRVRLTAEYTPEDAAALIAKIDGHIEHLGEDEPRPTVPAEAWTDEHHRDAAEAGVPEAPLAGSRWDMQEPVEVRRADALLLLVRSARPEEGPSDDDRTRVILHVRHWAGGEAEPEPEPDLEPDSEASERDAADVITFDEITEVARQAAADLARAGSGSTLENGHELSTETARRLACDAEVITMVEDALGNPVGVGRKTRKIPRRLRRALQHRDGGCRFPGCTARRWVDAHHVWFWSDGGPTEMDNLVLLCRHHHRLVHEVGYEVRVHAGQCFTFHRPDGTLITGAAPPVTGRADAPARANRAEGVLVDQDTMIPDWDGGPTDFDDALWVLWNATFPDGPPLEVAPDVSAVPPEEQPDL